MQVMYLWVPTGNRGQVSKFATLIKNFLPALADKYSLHSSCIPAPCSPPCRHSKKYSRQIHSYLSPYFWVPTGNRTLIESSTSSSVNRYTIGTIIIYRAPTVAYFAALIQFYLYVVRIYPCSAAMSFSLFSEPRTINTTGRSSPL